MSGDRWQQVEYIFHRAVDIAPPARAEFLARACGADESLRKEVESLLDFESGTGETFAGAAGGKAPLTIGHYRISGKLGEGGMGVVYRATDTKLGREVAIKVLPRFFAEDADRMARFSREAKVLAALNHPHIAQIYHFEDRALVMELVPGETLKRPLPLDTALSYAKQMAEALEAAHEKGIVHRDLKPTNIVVTPDGVVKLLDFGLAAVTQSAIYSDPTKSPTETLEATKAGTIMGTAAYMSPEQAAGKAVDKRADIWSFGAVLWEMLTGRRLFEGETVSEVLAGVLRAPIEFDKLPRETPAAIRRLLRRCLDRDVKNRLRDIGEARIAIEGVGEGPTEGAAVRGGWLGWGVAGVLVVGLAAVAFLHFREKPQTLATPLRFQIHVPEGANLPALSPDGRKVAFNVGARLWVHFLGSGESRDIAAGQGGTPVWSTDSRFIAYPVGGKLTKIDAAGGSAPQSLADFSGAWGGAAWNEDGVIVFSDQRVGFFRVSGSGGVPVSVTTVDPSRQEAIHFGPYFLPGGDHFLYTRVSTDPGKSGVYVGALDVRPEQQSSKPVVASNWQSEYAPSMKAGAGSLLFVRGGLLLAQPFDYRRLETTGQPATVVDHIRDNGAGVGGYAYYSVSSTDALLVQQSTATDRQLAWYSREGKVLGTAVEPGDYQALAVSPDAQFLAVSKRIGESENIWLLDLARAGASTRFTFGSAREEGPVWSPDGSRIVYSSNRDGPYNLYQKPVNGLKSEVALLKSSEDKQATSWSHDGRYLLYTVFHASVFGDIWMLPLEGGKQPIRVPLDQIRAGLAQFSPDGRWVAYVSPDSSGYNVYVQSFSVNSSGTVETGGKWQISDGFGTDPHWRGDGRELYYRSPSGRIMAVEIATNPAFRAGKPHPLAVLTAHSSAPSHGSSWDSDSAGKRFFGTAQSAPQPYTIILNWQAGLKK